MTNYLPSIPEELQAINTSNSITHIDQNYAKTLYLRCLNKLRQKKFPCIIEISFNKSDKTYAPQTSIDLVKRRLEEAGYQVNIEINLIEEDTKDTKDTKDTIDNITFIKTVKKQFMIIYNNL